MKSLCQANHECKYRGDLVEICPEYYRGSSEDGEPIILEKNFPLFCKDCKDRDFDFCKRFRDLICFNNQDPYDCKADLSKDTVYGLELAKKHHDAIRMAHLKRNLPFKEPKV